MLAGTTCRQFRICLHRFATRHFWQPPAEPTFATAESMLGGIKSVTALLSRLPVLHRAVARRATARRRTRSRVGARGFGSAASDAAARCANGLDSNGKHRSVFAAVRAPSPAGALCGTRFRRGIAAPGCPADMSCWTAAPRRRKKNSAGANSGACPVSRRFRGYLLGCGVTRRYGFTVLNPFGNLAVACSSERPGTTMTSSPSVQLAGVAT